MLVNDEIPQPVLSTKRLVLSPFVDNDLPDILEYASHPEVSRFVPWQSHKSLDDSKQFLNFATQSKKTTRGKLFYVFAIRLKESGKAIGSIDFKNITASTGQMDYALGYNYWHQGYMSEAAMAVRDWAFEHLPEMVRLQAYCIPENRGSSRVMEKIGMSHEGIRRKAYMLKGVPVDLADYSILRGENNV